MRPLDALRTADQLLSILDDRLPAVIAQINRDGADGYPTSTPGASAEGRGGTQVDEDGYPIISTSVEAAVLRRQRGAAHYNAIQNELHKVLDALSKIRSICDRYDHVDTKEIARQGRCFGGDPLCHNLAAVRRRQDGTEALRYGGLCERCYMAAYRARKKAEQ